MTTDWGGVRRNYPALGNWTFLNTATFGQLSIETTEAVSSHFSHRDREACGNFLEWFGDADEIRGLVAQLINASSEDIAFVANAASGLAVLTGGLEWAPGDRIITLDGEFPNNIYSPAVLAAQGVEFVEASWDGLRDAVTPNTRMVIVSTVNYITGFRPPLEELSRFLRQRNILLCVDGTQSVGALRFDCRQVQPAALVVDAYKWLLGPTGSGFLYVRDDLRDRITPSVVGWRSHKNWRDVANLHHGAPEFVTAAERYEGGMLNFPSLYGMAASIKALLAIGPDDVEHRVMELADLARQVLRNAGATLLADQHPHHCSPIVAAAFPGHDSAALARSLHARRIQVSARHGYLRVSTHMYNNERDIELLGRELKNLLG